jgi:hypothetical protein
MSSIALTRVVFRPPKFDKEKFMIYIGDRWKEWKEIVQRACPFIPVPSPLRESLAALD